MSATLHRLPSAASQIVSKQQLAAHLGRSARWIEMRMRDGMPSLEKTDRMGRRMFDLGAVEDWLQDGRPEPSTVAERLAVMEAEVARLRAEVRDLKRKVV